MLAWADTLPLDRLTRIQRIRNRLPPQFATGVVELLELRQRARAKFAHASEMFFTPEGLEQSTGERIAAYRASRFPDGVPVLDACCGNGGDAQAIYSRNPNRPILLADINPVALFCARENVRTVHSKMFPSQPSFTAPSFTAPSFTTPSFTPPSLAVCTDVTTLDLNRLRAHAFDAVLFDPSRRIDTDRGRRRAKSSEDYQPPLSFVHALTEHFGFVAVKVSPAIDDETLTATVERFLSSPSTLQAKEQGRPDEQAYVEFISEGNECKEAVLWLDRKGIKKESNGENYRATVLARDGTVTTLKRTLRRTLEEHPGVHEPREWLYEPNPAVIRAHLTPEVAIPMDGSYIHPQIAYFTADSFHVTPFATAYRVLECMPYNIKNLKAWLRTHRYRVEVVKRRGVPYEPEEVRKQLASRELADETPIVLVLTHQLDRSIALLCAFPQTPSSG